MSYSYSTPLTYGQQVPLSYDDYSNNPDVVKKKKSSVPAGIGGAVLGAAVGGIVTSRINPNIKNGQLTDTFSRVAYDRYAKKAEESVRNSYNQYNEVINKIDKIKTTEELKTLLTNNPEASKEITSGLNQTTEEYLSKVTEADLSSTKTTIKQALEAKNQVRYDNMKKDIKSCWNDSKKCFEKPDNFDETTFKAIKKASRQLKNGFVAKWIAISAAAAGVVAFVAHKLITNKKQKQDIQQ